MVLGSPEVITPRERIPQGSDPAAAFEQFDRMVMLTQSDWHTEPPSNRYHYTTRFARHLPVIFIQPDLKDRDYDIEETSVSNLLILHMAHAYGLDGAYRLNSIIEDEIGIKRPLIWI